MTWVAFFCDVVQHFLVTHQDWNVFDYVGVRFPLDWMPAKGKIFLNLIQINLQIFKYD